MTPNVKSPPKNRPHVLLPKPTTDNVSVSAHIHLHKPGRGCTSPYSGPVATFAQPFVREVSSTLLRAVRLLSSRHTRGVPTKCSTYTAAILVLCERCDSSGHISQTGDMPVWGKVCMRAIWHPASRKPPLRRPTVPIKKRRDGDALPPKVAFCTCQVGLFDGKPGNK